MSFNLSNSVDVIANSVRLINGNQLEDITSLFLSKDEAVSGIIGLPPATLNTLEKISNALDNDPNFFTSNAGRIDSKANTVEVQNKLNLKADVLTTYSKGQVDTKFTDIINSAPLALDTLAELATALNNDSNYASNIQNQIISKAAKTDVFTKAEVTTALDLKASIDGVFATLNNYDSRFVTTGKLDLKSDKATSFTQTEINDKLLLKQDSLLTGLVQNGVSVLTGKTIRALAVTAPLTIVNNGSSHLTLGIDQAALNQTPSWIVTTPNYNYLDAAVGGLVMRVGTESALQILGSSNTGAVGDALFYKNVSISGKLTVTGAATLNLPSKADLAYVNTQLGTKESLYDAVVPLKKVLNIPTGKIELRLDTDNLGILFATSLETTGALTVNGSASFKTGVGVVGDINITNNVFAGNKVKCNIFQGNGELVTIDDDVVITGSLRVDGATNINPFYVAATIDANATILKQKGKYDLRCVRLGVGAYQVSWPTAHPDGTIYCISCTSTDYHSFIQNQTTTSFIVLVKNNSNAAVDARLYVSVLL